MSSEQLSKWIAVFARSHSSRVNSKFSGVTYSTGSLRNSFRHWRSLSVVFCISDRLTKKSSLNRWNQTKWEFTFYSNKQNIITTPLLFVALSIIIIIGILWPNEWLSFCLSVWSLICCVSSRRVAMSWRWAKLISHHSHKPECCSDCHVTVCRSFKQKLDLNLCD